MVTPLQRQETTYLISAMDVAEIKIRMLNWCKQFSIHVFLDSNNYQSRDKRYDCLVGVGVHNHANASHDLASVQHLHESHQDWVFGHISYDYKNAIFPGLHSDGARTSGFPDLYFFVPEVVCFINADLTALTIACFGAADVVYDEIFASAAAMLAQVPQVNFTGTWNQATYEAAVAAVRGHIAKGDCYELNLCAKGFAEGVALDPMSVFSALNKLSPTPFAAFYRLGDSYLMCASPERYLKKEGNRLISQPIKGTARRDADAITDDGIKEALRNNVKEKAENVMIVDLVRNDLARSCVTGSISVDELFGIYTFPHVHQMISTVSGTIKPALPFMATLTNSFPMGSMTGAPKYKVMQLIEQYEPTARELFSGTVGYITPGGDFDFNVVIRSLFYNADTQYLSYQAGGAITFDSDPAKEWEEMRLKAWAMERIFSPEQA